MKQHTGAEIRRIMTDMPADLAARLQSLYAEHHITEREARWWGYLMFAKTDDYAPTEFTIKVTGTGEEVTQRFLPYVLEDRAGCARFGLVRKAWPEDGFV